MKPEIAIRADGNSKIGLGHIHRMIALAGYLTSFFSVRFFCFNADKLVIDLIEQSGFKHTAIYESDYTSPAHLIGLLRGEEIIVLDGYEFKTDYQAALKEAGHRVIAIDDLNQWENVANVVINHAYSGAIADYKKSEETEFYGGLKYAIIKQEILNAKTKTLKTSVDKVLVCIGGTDPMNYSEKIVSELLKDTSKHISLLTYPLNPKFDELKQIALINKERMAVFASLNTKELIGVIRNNDIAILQPSNIALEAASIGIGVFLIQTAENQKYILDTLLQNNCACLLQLNTIGRQMHAITSKDINAQILNQHQLLDGKSPQRIVEIVNTLYLRVRNVKEEDAKLIYDWNNDAVTRANSYNQAKIEYIDHLNWLSQKLKDKTTIFLLFTFNNEDAGCVRIDEKTNENIIGITVAPEMRGKRLATPILKMACKEYFERTDKIDISAYIKKTNEASLKSFLNAGFSIIEEGNFFGELSYKLIKKSNE